jgi:hypothetical protein
MSLDQINSTVCRLNLRHAALAIEKGDLHNASIFIVAAFDHAFNAIRPPRIAGANIDEKVLFHLNALNDRISLMSYGIKMTDYDKFRQTVAVTPRETHAGRSELQRAFRFTISVIAIIEADHNLDSQR